MAFSVSYRLARVTTYYEDAEGYVLINDYYGIEGNGSLLVKKEEDSTLYQVAIGELDDFSTDDNWFTIDGCRGLKPAKNLDPSWSQFVDQIFDQARRECKYGDIEKECEKLIQRYS